MKSETAGSAARADKTLKYCPRCKNVFLSVDEKCGCGKKFAKKIDTDAAVELARVTSDKLYAIETCLANEEVPYSLSEHSGYSAAIGKISGTISVLVPLGFLKRSYTALSEEGLIDVPESGLMAALPDDAVWDELPAGKAAAVRAAAIIGFLFVIYLCVAGVDLVTAAIANFFS